MEINRLPFDDPERQQDRHSAILKMIVDARAKRANVLTEQEFLSVDQDTQLYTFAVNTHILDILRAIRKGILNDEPEEIQSRAITLDDSNPTVIQPRVIQLNQFPASHAPEDSILLDLVPAQSRRQAMNEAIEPLWNILHNSKIGLPKDATSAQITSKTKSGISIFEGTMSGDRTAFFAVPTRLPGVHFLYYFPNRTGPQIARPPAGIMVEPFTPKQQSGTSTKARRG